MSLVIVLMLYAQIVHISHGLKNVYQKNATGINP
jgi:hypothetical protein